MTDVRPEVPIRARASVPDAPVPDAVPEPRPAAARPRPSG